MKTMAQLKQQVIYQAAKSGYVKNAQAGIKSYVLDIVDKETKANKQKLGFEYQNPYIKRMRSYPLTSVCLDLIQQFLESFKFKHTLYVFKKEINRDLTISRKNLVRQFNVDLSGKDQSVLLSIVGQVVDGDVKIMDKSKQDLNNGGPKRNNFMNEDPYNRNDHNNKNKNKQTQNKSFNQDERSREQKKAPQKDIKNHSKKYDIPQAKPKVQQKTKQQVRKQEEMKKKIEEEKQKQLQRLKQIQRQKQLERQKQQDKEKEKEKQKQKQKGKGKKSKKQQQKPPQGATDLLADVMGKFKLDKNNKKSSDEQFKARKAFSQQKQQKKIVPEQSGTNKIRGISMGKLGTPSSSSGGISSFMKFSSFNNQPTKNESIDEQFDQLQQSKDSTRRNPLYSSSQSGFDKSNGYDQSVDSMAIEDYQYVERAKKFAKKL